MSAENNNSRSPDSILRKIFNTDIGDMNTILSSYINSEKAIKSYIYKILSQLPKTEIFSEKINKLKSLKKEIDNNIKNNKNEPELYWTKQTRIFLEVLETDIEIDKMDLQGYVPVRDHIKSTRKRRSGSRSGRNGTKKSRSRK